MKKIAMSVAGMAFAFMATQASAALIEDFGVIPVPSGTQEIILFAPRFVENVNGAAGTDFEDSYFFEIVDPVSVTDISIIRLPLSQRGEDLLLFQPFQTRLINGGDRVLFDSDGQSGDLENLTPDIYEIRITGTAIGTFGGQYTGVLAVSSVPIPAAGLLFFSGIAALGLVRSKRASA